MTPFELALATLLGVSLGLVWYVYFGYPALVWVLARLFGRPPARFAMGSTGLPSVSVVLTAYNEAGSIERRLQEFVDRIAGQGLTGEVIVVSDGSTDGTDGVIRAFERRGSPVPVRLVALPQNVGKATALTAGCRAAKSEIIVMADARQTWASDALACLLDNFADPTVGAVSGELVIETAAGVMAGVGLYWRYEKWLRRREALIHSTVGVTGAICAVRRELFQPIPAGTLLDDVYWPLCVAMQGYRVVFDGRALAFDRLPTRAGSEFCRKVRTLAGNFQLIARLPATLLPWRNPVWFAVISHKLGRLAVPWAYVAATGLSAAVGGPVFNLLCSALAAPLLLGLIGLYPAAARRSRVLSVAASLLILNAAAWWAFWIWMSGRATRSWKKTRYEAPAPRPEVAAAFAAVGR